MIRGLKKQGYEPATHSDFMNIDCFRQKMSLGKKFLFFFLKRRLCIFYIVTMKLLYTIKWEFFVFYYSFLPTHMRQCCTHLLLGHFKLPINLYSQDPNSRKRSLSEKQGQEYFGLGFSRNKWFLRLNAWGKDWEGRGSKLGEAARYLSAG